MDVKVEQKPINGTPLPQRNPPAGGNVAGSGPAATPNPPAGGPTGGAANVQPQQQQQGSNMPPPTQPGPGQQMDRKPNFNQQNMNQNRGGGGGGGGRGGGQMNRGQNRGGGGGNKFGGGGQGGQGRQGQNQNQNRQGGGGFQNRRQNLGDKDNDSIMSDNMSISSGGGRGGNRGGDRMNKGDRMRKNDGDFSIGHKLKNLQGPTHELAPIEYEEVKFSGRNRLYIGNITNDTTESDLQDLFKPFGEIAETFLNAEKNFAFVKVDFHANAERAKRELDGLNRKNRTLRVRFAPNATTIRVKNLTPFITNELLYRSFEIFGPLERAVIIVDDRGKPSGEGIVEFTRKSGAMAALRLCSEKCFFLTSSLRPCVLEMFEHIDDTDGFSEKTINKKNADFYNARQVGPRFAEPNSFEHEYGTRWKQLHELFKKKHESLKEEMLMEENKLEAQMEFARYEHETEMLREQLRQREQDRDARKSEWELQERYAEEQRNRSEEHMRQIQEDMAMQMSRQEDELRRRQQENTLFMQAQQLNSMLDAQEKNQGSSGGGAAGSQVDGGGKMFGGSQSGGSFRGSQDGGGGGNPFMDGGANRGGMTAGNRMNDQMGGGGVGGGNRGGSGGPRNPWVNNNQDQRNDAGFQNKRRRF